ncbi:SET domain-containing protein 2 [Cladobotryum mycophilum]|uniref:Histone-lysine N-methyltransferase, H3 lysine-36 specific n=1 Tax=Cladobotryum mycophilum TaxID=491253 RepID=A0ABR0SAJ1_9HYPO
MEDEESATKKMEKVKLEDAVENDAHTDKGDAASVSTPKPGNGGTQSPASVDGAKSRSESADTPGSSSRSSRLSRKASQKLAAREIPLYGHLPDVTEESCKAFQAIPDCLYGSKNLGSTDNDALDCDCREDFRNGENFACGEDTDCINRATKMECSATSGNCGGGCQNQRFQRKQYANGFGLRSNADLQPNDFIFEYIGEVINEPTFRRRMIQYDDEGIKHFYFMSLNKNEFVDATKKGNLGRFCNHSCNPNCFVDKWVVGDKLRMGIFALRKIRAGEELVFNYNVDRYGAEPQPCYCGEYNCVGFIGGKTQTERATKLPTTTVEALGIDGTDGWDTAVAKKPRKKRPEEDDEEYVNSIQPRSLNEDDSRKVMATLMQCKEKWIAVKLLERIQRSDEEKVIHCVMRMHAYQILKTTLNTFLDDHNVVLQVLSILDKFPRLTRNKIQDSNIEATIQTLADSEHDDVASQSKKLLDEWSKLEVAYRIRRRKFDPNAPAENIFDERRGAQAREEDAAQSTPKTASPAPIDAPKGPRSNIPQRNNVAFFNGPRQRRPPFHSPLPQGWFAAKDAGGNTYFYNKQGTSTWNRPTQPAAPEPASKAPSKALQEQLVIQSIIDKVTKEGTPKPSASQTPIPMETSPRDPKKDKALTLEKQMKLYEHTVHPPVKHVLDKFSSKLPKEELKRLGKDVAKKVVASDFKNNRVSDPSLPLTEKQERNIKKFVKDFLDRAVEKFESHQKKRVAGVAKKESTGDQAPNDKPASVAESGAAADEAEDLVLSDADSPEGADRKRKRDDEVVDSIVNTQADGPDMKRLKEDGASGVSPPPPPPPPPQSALESLRAEEEQALLEQEEALMRENEEAQRLDDEEQAKKREAAARSNLGPTEQRTSLDEHGNARKRELMSH